MHPPEVRATVLKLSLQGMSDSAVGAAVGLPRSTVGYMREAAERPPKHPLCPRCWRRGRPVRLSDEDYAELLGFYLGDGCLSRAGRVMRLRINLDARYAGILKEATDLLRRGFPESSVGSTEADEGASVMLSVYSSHLTCLFPQHGPGKKHERSIVLERWQKGKVEAAPWAFIRGCIYSDGCSFVNVTGPYRYLAYEFRNYSSDIRGLFAEACDRVGVQYRANGTRVRINRRASVALMRDQVGIKA